MMDLSTAIKIGRINGKGEVRKRLGMSYVKVAPVPRTISDTVDLWMNHESYGLSADELHTMMESMNDR